MSYEQPPFNITNSMLTYVAQISEKLGMISSIHELDSHPRLRRDNRIRSIHSSLKIEANSLSLGQVADVLNGRPVIGEAREIQEVKNACAAYDMLPDINPYSLKDLKKVHGVMTRHLLEESGTFRQGEEGVFQGNTCIFMAPPAQRVPELMRQLFAWMRRADKEGLVHPLILSAVFHYEFVFIHPFADGNGRMARLWHTALLAKWKPVFAYIPIESQIEKFQEGYYEAIVACNKEGTSDQFIVFMLARIDEILTEISKQLPKEEKATEYVRRLLAVMDPGVPYTAMALMGELGLKSRETFRKHYLDPAMELQLVERTVPDKPRSRNQRYVRI